MHLDIYEVQKKVVEVGPIDDLVSLDMWVLFDMMTEPPTEVASFFSQEKSDEAAKKANNGQTWFKGTYL